MIRALAVLPALAVILAVAPAAPVPKERSKGPLYFPTAKGAKWVYALGQAELVEVVSAVERKGGATLVSVGREKGGRVSPFRTVAVSERGVAVVTEAGRDLPAPLWLVKLPSKPDEVYEVTNPDTGVRAWSMAGEAYGVEVPAGKFMTIPVVSHFTEAGATGQATFEWYAPGVGVVRRMTESGCARTVMVLKSFTPGKD